MRTLSPEGRRFIEGWEELVLYVYDDKVPPRRCADGKVRYPEWDGGPVRGTLTIGYGHTDAAGPPQIYPGMRITREQADMILSADLRPVINTVNGGVKVPLTQGQFDALVSFTFNAGAGSLQKLVGGLNRGDYDDVARRLPLYVYSRGERMQGLANRRAGELVLWNEPDPVPPDAPPDVEPEIIFSPKAEPGPPPKSMAESRTGWAAIFGTLTMVGTALGQAVDALRPLFADPRTVTILVVVGLGVGTFIWLDRRAKLRRDHV